MTRPTKWIPSNGSPGCSAEFLAGVAASACLYHYLLCPLRSSGCPFAGGQVSGTLHPHPRDAVELVDKIREEVSKDDATLPKRNLRTKNPPREAVKTGRTDPRMRTPSNSRPGKRKIFRTEEDPYPDKPPSSKTKRSLHLDGVARTPRSPPEKILMAM